MPLTLAPIDVALRVIRILADDKTKKHLESLGITINSEIRVLSHSGGNAICAVKGSRLAFDRDVAVKILVA